MFPENIMASWSAWSTGLQLDMSARRELENEIARICVLEQRASALIQHVPINALRLEGGDFALPGRALGFEPARRAENGSLPMVGNMVNRGWLGPQQERRRGKNQLAVWRALIGYGRPMTTTELLGFVKPRLKAEGCRSAALLVCDQASCRALRGAGRAKDAAAEVDRQARSARWQEGLRSDLERR